MPEQLRRRISEAAQNEGRSLNREIVERLEASLREEVQTRPIIRRAHDVRPNLRGRGMSTQTS